MTKAQRLMAAMNYFREKILRGNFDPGVLTGLDDGEKIALAEHMRVIEKRMQRSVN